MLPSLDGQRVLVMGLGRFGGGVGVTRFLVGRGAKVTVTDTADADSLAESIARLEGLDVRYALGGHRTEDFIETDWVVVNPAVDPRNNPWLALAGQCGAKLTSEIRLLTAALPERRRIIGITGSAGKSTVTAMIGHVLRARLGDDRVWIGGNLGGSLLGSLERIQPRDWVVLELSSFMLEGLDADQWSPHLAVLTGLSPNHLDRHGTLAAYLRAKAAIFRWQRGQDGDAAVLGPLDDSIAPSEVQALQPRAGRRVNVTEDEVDAWSIPLLTPGRHNRLNALLAVRTCALALEESQAQSDQAIDPMSLAGDLADFPGLPHRLQFVLEHQGVRYFNDSKSTTPAAAVMAIRSFPRGKVHLIAGGYDKGSDLTELAQVAAKRCRSVACIGATGPNLARLTDAAKGDQAQVLNCGDLEQATIWLAQRLAPDDVVLLSPGCASWDQFENFQKRGQAFVSAVLATTGEGCPPVRPRDEPTS
ncbi:MAG: UDP-N-acetylmuramoyl-L-alanine--D-glutamate ligase [Phycisphaeraceae bacterium]|nr:UDP-N-acetylmuramoyl-L-alanine--D-glutamate ligase [Phycisphaeraceae bacterium]